MPSRPPSELSPVAMVSTGCAASWPLRKRRTRPGRSLTTVSARTATAPSGPHALFDSSRQEGLCPEAALQRGSQAHDASRPMRRTRIRAFIAYEPEAEEAARSALGQIDDVLVLIGERHRERLLVLGLRGDALFGIPGRRLPGRRGRHFGLLLLDLALVGHRTPDQTATAAWSQANVMTWCSVSRSFPAMASGPRWPGSASACSKAWNCPCASS